VDIDPPLFVFVTAYHEHAMKAFEAQAVDYLLKPVEEDRLADTIERVRQRLAEKQGAQEAERLKEMLSEVAPEAMPDDLGEDEPQAGRFEKLINIKDRGQIFRVDVDISSASMPPAITCASTPATTLVLRETMKDLEKPARSARFQRIHRSTIVNLDNIGGEAAHQRRMLPGAGFSGAQVKVSRSYRDVVARFVTCPASPP
jgi:two-component system, LytTR family, response regulator